MTMYRFLTLGRNRGVGRLFLEQRNSCLGAKKHGALVTAGPASSIPRLYSQYSSQRHLSYSYCKAKSNFCSSYTKNSLLSTSNNIVTHHAQVAWKGLYQICSYNWPSFPPISKIACAVSLALTRSPVIVPSIFALVLGNAAWTRRTLADGHSEQFATSNSIYMHARNGHLYLSSLFSIFDGIMLLFRSKYLAILFSPSIMAPFADCMGENFRKIWLRVVRVTLEKAGPAFIKWGQWTATRPDLFPRDLSHTFAYSKKTIEKAFGRKLPEIFEDFEEEPLRYPGQKSKPIVVAVKVRHPGVGESIRTDFAIINVVAKISNFIPALKWLRLDESVQQFAVFMMSQVDNFIHADMHPGNILVRVPKGKPSRKKLFKSRHHVIFLDVGMTAELSKSDRVNLLEFFKAVAVRDGRTAAECTLRLSKQQNCPNPKAFIEEVSKSFAFWGTPEGDIVHPADCMLHLLEQVRRHKVNVDGNVCTVMVTMLVLEGWQRKLDPDYDVMRTLQTLLFKKDWAESLVYTIEGLMAPKKLLFF
ncbi:hypothetical protein MKX01_037391 [Papaver californicum]|nr:hypothetical protein MKX01_037391 [Papaver californicum]